MAEYNCLYCKNIYKRQPKAKGKYCSAQCQQDHKFSSNFNLWLNKKKIFEDNNRRFIKRCVIHRLGSRCYVCNITNWNSQTLVFELEHLDGNSSNNYPENLELICPNCHSQTDTYKAKNKGNGRYFRRQRYKENKSY